MIKMKYNDIEKEVLKRITPSRILKKEIKSIVKDLKIRIGKEIEKKKIPATVELVGSVAKDTFLKDDLDIDFFLCFPTKYSKNEIANVALSIGKDLLDEAEESYAEHPYIKGKFRGYSVEIVPCYKIEEAKQKLSAVDRTPLHTRFVKENLKKSQKADVRLLKKFLRGIGCYGAEAEVQGFSGYLCELLIMKYKSFKELINSAKNWRYGEKLSLKKCYYPDFDSPLIFIDPVDPKRNVASALAKEKFELFIRACKEYSEKPDIRFFFPNKIKPWSLKKIKEETKDMFFVGIKFKKPHIIDENLYPQLRKAVNSISEASVREGFKIYDIRFYVDYLNNDVYIIIKTDENPLPEILVHEGPPLRLKRNVEDFINKWSKACNVVKGPYQKDGRYYVEIKRRYTQLKDFIKNELRKLSLGKNIDEVVKNKFYILDKDNLFIEELRLFWTSYLDGRMSWER